MKKIKRKIKNIFEKQEKQGKFLGKVYRKAIDRKRAARYEQFAEIAIDETLVVFESFMGRKYTDSPKAIYEYMLSNKKFINFRFVWCFRDSVKSQYKFVGDRERTTLVRWGTDEYYKAYATAKYWVTNTRLPKVIYKKEGQQYIQCWHGTPLKKLFCDIETEAMESKETTKRVVHEDASRYSYLISPSKYCSEKLASAFDLKTLHKDNIIIEKGYPRNDAIVNYTQEDVISVKKELGLPMEKKVILYAPTYRENQRNNDKQYQHSETLDFEKLQKEIGDNYIILFRTHYYIANEFNFDKYNGFVFDVSKYPEINDLYVISDLLITDYSSVFFDFGILKRPMIFYMYDLDFYKDDLRGFYLSLDELPGPIVKTEKELIEKIQNLSNWTNTSEYKKAIQEFNEKFTYNEDGHATERVVDQIFR
ncbi:MAG: CDP-glycerol glycerophosphotransferase family protein [Alphaproteobacteria bacterium]|nr:CDP-glycerol glycerophosphotransferase family protein [Alphaproteobacteria bacterium]